MVTRVQRLWSFQADLVFSPSSTLVSLDKPDHCVSWAVELRARRSKVAGQQ